jgi:membrane protein involved in colicin uptake
MCRATYVPRPRLTARRRCDGGGGEYFGGRGGGGGGGGDGGGGQVIQQGEIRIQYKVMRTQSGKKQRVRLKENKKATKKIDAPVIAFGAEEIKDKESERSSSVDGTRVDEWASKAAAQTKRRVREKEKQSEEKKPLTR